MTQQQVNQLATITKNAIPKGAFSRYMSAYLRFCHNGGCDYERLAVDEDMIKHEYDLTEEEFSVVARWVLKKYSEQYSPKRCCKIFQ